MKNHFPENQIPPKGKELATIIKKASPLYDYWDSQQDEDDEKARLSKASQSSSASYLFKEEPYKWENLYQSITREIARGDRDSIRGLRIILDTINSPEKEKMLKAFSDNKIIDGEMLSLIKQEDTSKISTTKNILRFARILFAIFTNPYGIEMKRSKVHIYERTGATIYALRKARS